LTKRGRNGSAIFYKGRRILNEHRNKLYPDNLFAGHEIPVLVKGVTLEAGQGELKRGTVLAR